METKNSGEIKGQLAEVHNAIDFLLWKLDRSKDNLKPYIGVIDLQAALVVQAVKRLKDVVEAG